MISPVVKITNYSLPIRCIFWSSIKKAGTVKEEKKVRSTAFLKNSLLIG